MDFNYISKSNLYDPTIRILFITVLDILDEILTIVPGITREHIMRKPVDKKRYLQIL